MKRSLLIAATLVIFMLAIAFSSALPSGAVKAQPPDKCLICLGKVQRDYEKCQAKYGPVVQCDEQFNNDIVNCYATVCEQ